MASNVPAIMPGEPGHAVRSHFDAASWAVNYFSVSIWPVRWPAKSHTTISVLNKLDLFNLIKHNSILASDLANIRHKFNALLFEFVQFIIETI